MVGCAGLSAEDTVENVIVVIKLICCYWFSYKQGSDDMVPIEPVELRWVKLLAK